MHLQKSWLVLFKMIVLWNRRRDAFEEVLARFVALAGELALGDRRLGTAALDSLARCEGNGTAFRRDRGRQLALERRLQWPWDLQLALERRFRRPLDVKFTLERHFPRTLDVKLALERRF